ncbi:MAG TPA: hypothetical protein VG368_01365, partial [Acidimicrobiales bacterium]|nr:hypothetical protein [Acidimicrobiales bacterium]
MITASVPGVELTRDGAVVAPSDLFAHTAPVTASNLAAVVEFARRTGRIFERDGLAIYGIGEAARIVLPAGLGPKDAAAEATQLLAGIGHDGTPPIGLGTIAFESDRETFFVIPSVCVIIADGAPPVGLVAGEPAAIIERLDAFPFTASDSPTLERETPPDAFELVSVRSHDDFRKRVTDATAAIARGEIDKVVLAREIT